MEVLQAGVVATFQDAGRVGHRARGINPSGAMDGFAMRVVNALVGNELQAAVLEMHFPAPKLRFHVPAVVCLGGADFGAQIDGNAAELWRPYCLAAHSELSFSGRASGHRAYLSVMDGWDLPAWLGSASTNLQAGLGGWRGRPLLKGDRIPLRTCQLPADARALPWKVSSALLEQTYSQRRVRLLPGPEWDWLTESAQQALLNQTFSIAPESNRTGYRLRGAPLTRSREHELLSGGVTFGTVQLPPGGEPIILMADHPVTGGYPRVAQVMDADLPFLAQQGPGAEVAFARGSQAEAERLYLTLDRELRQLSEACRARRDQWLSTAST